MKKQGELCVDVKEVTRKASEIHAEKTSERDERTSHDAEAEVPVGVAKDKETLEDLNWKQNDGDMSAQKEEGQSSQAKMRRKSCGDVKEVTRKTSEIEARETSERQERTSRDAESDDDEELLKKLKQRKENDDDKSAIKKESSQAKIQRVMPYLLKIIDPKHIKLFHPRTILFGPILRGKKVHWIKKDMKLQSKGLKVILAREFIQSSGMEPEHFLKEIKDHIGELMECFSKGVISDYDPGSLATLLFLDGCAVLQFIHSYVRGELEKFKINSTQAAFIQQDLFLFENQIPFKVLTLLMGVSDMGATGKEKEKPSFRYKASIIQFVHENNICATINAFNYYRKRYYREMIDKLKIIKPVHLLDLLHKVSVFGSIKDIVEFAKDERDNVENSVFGCINIVESARDGRDAGNCVLTVTGQQKNRDSFLHELEEHGRRVEWQSLRSVQELKSSGITMTLSHSRSLKSISFSAHCFGMFGHIKLPALNVNDSTLRKLLSLVAYERCLDDSERYYSVTSYLNFLDLLIDTEQDVKDLRIARIIRNALGSDGEVAQLFNSTLGLTYLPKPKEDHFEKIYNKIAEHYARKWKIKIGQICLYYLRSPWRTLSPFLAPAALLFTVIQTWYTIYPR